MEFNTRIKNTKSLIKLLISELSERDVWATKTKIYKYMYLVDFGSYALYKKSMSGTPYLKFKFGPVPFAVDTLLNSMVENNELELKDMSGKNGSYQCYLLPTIFKNEFFTDKQIEIVTKTLDYFKDSPARELSKETHYHYGWVAIKNGETIPLESAEFTDFEWLDYSKDGKESEDFKELKKTRDLLSNTPSLSSLMRKVQNI